MAEQTPQRIAVRSRWRGFSSPHRILCVLLASLQLLLPSLVVALPTDGNVVGGNAEIQQISPTQLTIQQTTDRAIINWQSFSIGADEAVRFVQPSINSIALNRVTGIDPSVILGNLEANGRIFLLNPNGILFGAGAQINVGGLLATTLQIRDDDFMAGRYLFAQDPLKSLKSVVNQGTIHVSDHGFVILAAPGVANEGLIVANLGNAVLGSGRALTVDLMGDGLIKYALSGKVLDQVVGVDGKPLSSAVSNTGMVQADGGHVILQAKAAGDIFSSVVNQNGVIRARSLVNQEGVVRLDGGESGLVRVAGTLDASGLSIGQKGGRVSVLGQSIQLSDSASINVSGDVGGGTSLIGGNYQGAGPEPNAASMSVAAGSSITADAITQGDGGNVIVWADGHTAYAGQISAKGGRTGGNGGFVEVSGKNTLDFTGRVDTSAPAGLTGTLLLDPSDITISTAANSNISAGPTFTGTAATSNLNVTTLQTALGTNNVIVDTTSPFASAGNITVSNAVTWASANSLDLRAHNDITVNAGISSTGLGVLRLIGNQDGIGGGNVAVNVAISARLGGIEISGVGVTSNAAGTITTTGLANQNAGNVTINATGALSLMGAVTANGGTAGAGTPGRAGGTISITGTTGVTTGTITASGSNGNGANQDGGNAGTISVTNTTSGNLTTGALTARTGNAVGTGAGGATGSITVTQNNAAAGAFLQTGAINTVGGSNGAGGAITLSSQSALQFGVAATIQANGGTALAGTSGQNSSNVSLSGRTVTTTGAITASGSAGNGADQAGGHAGNITVTSNGAMNLSAGALTASGGNAGTGNAAGGNGGVISLTNNSTTTGDLTTGALTARTGNAIGTGAGGTAGSVAVTQNNATAGATLQTVAINTSGGTKGAGGAVVLNSASNVNVTSTITTTGGAVVSGSTHAGAVGGNVAITGVNRTVSGTITANGGAAIGTNQAGGNAGVVSSTGTGFSTTGAINSRTGAATGTGAGGAAGSITLSGTTVSSGAINASGLANGIGGNVSVTSTSGTTTLTTITTSGGTANADTAGRNAGAVMLASAGNVTTATLTANGSNGNGADQAGGNGGIVSATSTSGNVTVGAISVIGGNGLAGNAAGGNGGNATLDAGGATPAITHVNITTTGGNRSGTGTAGAGGNVSVADATLLSTNTTITGSGGSAGLGTGGNVTFNSTVNGAQSLTLDAGTGNIAMNGIVGGLTPLTNLTIVNGGNVTFGNSVTVTGNLLQSAGTGTTILNGATVGGNLTLTTGTITLATAPVSVTGGPITLTAANNVDQNANLTASGVNPVTVTATSGPITMAGAATTSSGSGSITYSAGTNMTLGSLATGGAVDVMANGGSVLSAPGSGTNLTAGANSTLQAFNGVVGTQANPMTVNVNPGTLGIRATTAVSGISAFLTGTVLPSNALTLLNVPPGLVCFNGCPVPPSNGFNGAIPSFNIDSVVPWYLREPSDPPMISLFASYLSTSVLAEPEVNVQSSEKSVGREIPPCFPESACKPAATSLTTFVEGDSADAR